MATSATTLDTTTAAPRLPAHRPCTAIRVVVVDDDPSFAAALADNLHDDGHDVRCFARPRELPPLTSLEADALVTDYDMGAGEMTGLALADAVHARHPALPIVLVTAHAGGLLDGEVAARAEFLRLCVKPVDYDALHALLHGARVGTRS
jgi:two-component system response regulator GlrR